MLPLMAARAANQGAGHRIFRFHKLAKRIARRFDAQTAEAWLRAMERGRGGISEKALRSALASGDLASIEASLGGTAFGQALQELEDPFANCAGAMGSETAKSLGDSGFAYQFSARHPNVILYARDQSAQLVTGVTEDVREAIRVVTALGASQGLTVQQQARALREIVGLPGHWANAPLSLADEIRTGQIAAATGRRLSAVDKAMIRSRINAGTADEAFVASMQSKYTKSLLNARALTIARTETLRAAHFGQQESWQQAIRQGVLPRDSRRFWIVTPDERLSPEHARIPGMNPKGRRMDEPFVTPEGEFLHPPSRPNCRCGLGLGVPSGAARTGATVKGKGGQFPLPLPKGVAADIPTPTLRGEELVSRLRVGQTGFSAEQVDAFRSYSGQYYEAINGGLRHGVALPGIEQGIVSHLDSAFLSVQPTDAGLLLHRGGKLRRELLKVGAEFTDDAFVSTSADTSRAANFFLEMVETGAKPKTGYELVRVEIKTPIGTRAVLMTKELSHHPREIEVLLQRGGRFRVTAVEERSLRANKIAKKRGIERYYRVEMEYEPPVVALDAPVVVEPAIAPQAPVQFRTIGDFADDAARTLVDEPAPMAFSDTAATEARAYGYFDPVTRIAHLSRKTSEDLVRYWHGDRDSAAVRAAKSLFHEQLHSTSPLLRQGNPGEWWPFIEEGIVERRARRHALRLAFGNGPLPEGISDFTIGTYAKEVQAIDWVSRHYGNEAVEALWRLDTAQARTARLSKHVRDWLRPTLKANGMTKAEVDAVLDQLGDDAWHILRTWDVAKINSSKRAALKTLFREQYEVTFGERVSASSKPFARVAADSDAEAVLDEAFKVCPLGIQLVIDTDGSFTYMVGNAAKKCRVRTRLTEEQVRAIEDYQNGSYIAINKRLRLEGSKYRMEGTRPRPLTGKTDRTIGALDATFDALPRTTKPAVVYRGGSLAPPKGTTLVDYGYVSTTTDKEIAYEFFENRLNRALPSKGGRLPTFFEVKIPKGKKALWMKQITNDGYESELLLPRGTKYKIVRKEQMTLAQWASKYGPRWMREELSELKLVYGPAANWPKWQYKYWARMVQFISVTMQ